MKLPSKLKRLIRKVFNCKFYKYAGSSGQKVYSIVSVDNWDVYEISDNTLSPMLEDKLFIGTPYVRCSEEEYYKFFRNNVCDCPIGKGRNIKRAKAYDVADVMTKHYGGEYVVTNVIHTDDKGRKRATNSYTVKHEAADKTYTVDFFGSYYKKACLNCGKCLDEKPDLIMKFDKRHNSEINFQFLSMKEKEDRSKELRMIEEICGSD